MQVVLWGKVHAFIEPPKVRTTVACWPDGTPLLVAQGGDDVWCGRIVTAGLPIAEVSDDAPGLCWQCRYNKAVRRCVAEDCVVVLRSKNNYCRDHRDG